MVDPNPIITSVDPSAQVLADIDSALRDIHKYCIDNLDSLTQAERSSFMDENSSLADVLANKGATRSILLQTLDERKKLKLRIESACSRHQVLDFIKRQPASPATTIGMVNIDSSHAPILAPRPTPPSERPISVQSNLALTNRPHLGPSYPSTGTPGLTIPCDDYECDDTSSITSAAFMEESPCGSFIQKDCMIFSDGSCITGATFNTESEGATGAIISSHDNSLPLGFSGQRLPPAGARQTQAGVITSSNRVVYFSPGTIVDSPTMNIRSAGASGARVHS